VEEIETTLTPTGQYHIRVRKADWEVEVTAPEKDFVSSESDRLIDLLSALVKTTNVRESENGHGVPVVHSPIVHAEVEQTRIVKPQTLNEFFRQYKVQTHLDKILVLGYWCEVKQGQTHFTSEDVLAKYKEVKEPQPANIRRDLGSLVAKGLLLVDGKSAEGASAYELTNTGINEVETKLPRS